MSSYRHLLLMVPAGMQRSPAVDRALALASASGATLHAVTFLPSLGQEHGWLSAAEAPEEVRVAYVQRHRDWIEEQAAEARRQGVQVSTEVILVNDPLQDILLYMREVRADLLIKDVHHESLLRRAFATPLDWQLLRESPVPLYLVHDREQPLPRKVVATVDPFRPEHQLHAANEQIIAAARAFADCCSAELHLLHVFDASGIYSVERGLGAMPLSGGLSDGVRQSQEDAFDLLAEQHGIGEGRRHFLVGPAARLIAEFAERERVDVLVMGITHHRGLGKLLGSTIEHVLYRVPCGILAIRPQD